ncbi:MAG: InlB B-repeat-containing protein [Treponema sp.]|nr:InlB B-repeat-containing protein [Treponema sp.]
MKNRNKKFGVMIFLIAFSLFSSCDTSSTQPYKISFEANGGTPAPDYVLVWRGGKIEIPEPMIKTGYGFGGWFKEAALVNEWDFATDTVTGNITLFAKWDINYYTANFNADDGDPAPNHQNIAHGSKVVPPPEMIRTGYTFDGWYKEETFTNKWDFSIDTIAENITLFAKWLENFIVTFEANGGSSEPSQQNIAHGSKVVLPPEMTRIGYTFDCWYKEDTFTNKWDFSIDTITESITLFAKWLENFTVTFEANGGIPSPSHQNIAHGSKVVPPPVIIKTGCNFGGWYREAEFINLWDFYSDMITENTILYAKWDPPFLVPGANFNAKMRWLDTDTNVQSDNFYIIEVDSDLIISPLLLSFNGKNNIIIAFIGIDSRRVIRLNTTREPLFTVGNGVTLILDNNLDLQGSNLSSSSLIKVNSGGNFILNHGSKITGNKSYYQGGGVYVDSYGSFTMNGGEISGNTVSASVPLSVINPITSSGGGVYVNSHGIFTMNGGEILNNISSSTGTGLNHLTFLSCGGGVYVNGFFIMNDGKISGNSSFATHSNGGSYITSNSYGGGVYVNNNGIFTMNGGEISGNTVSASGSLTSRSCGAGVFINNGTFSMNNGKILSNICTTAREARGGGIFLSGGNLTMYDGKISGNISGSGGGVYVNSNGIFTMINGDISDNIANSNSTSQWNFGGGGVHIERGTFSMSNGEIYGNTSIIDSTGIGDPYLGFGGGVYINSSIFHKTGGTIFGYTEGNSKSNVVRTSSGVIRQGHTIHFNHSNSIYRMGKNSTLEPTDNLSLNGTINPPTWSGNLDY